MARPADAERVPHSWELANWPAHVWPGDAARARYLVRTHFRELQKHDVVKRPGKKLVFIGSRYARWLESQAPAQLDDVLPAANRARKHK